MAEGEKTLLIVRGPAGVGKTTWVNKSYQNVPIFAADDFFMSTGEYKFDASKLNEAHSQCLNDVLRAMQRGEPFIIVNNTFTKRWEWANYEVAARLAGYRVEMVEIVPSCFDEARLCALRGAHAVPAPTVYTMVIEFEHCPWARVLPMGTLEAAAVGTDARAVPE